MASVMLIAAIPALIATARANTPPPEDEVAPPPDTKATVAPADYTPTPVVTPFPVNAVEPANPSGIVALIGQTANLSVMASSIKAAGLSDMLSGAGALTVFAPTNDAFAKLPADARTALMNTDNKTVLARIISHHVVVGALGGTDLTARIGKGGGTTTLTMLTGEPVTVELQNGAVVLRDRTGNRMRVIQSLKAPNNSIVHLVDSLIMPQPRTYSR